MKQYYLYFHIRLDTNEVFYVGIGKLAKKEPYKRAHSKGRRNKFWKNVVDKTDYRIEIKEETDDRQLICDLEKQYILQFGRRDLNTGSLVNLTSGGDANFKMSQEALKRSVATRIANGVYARISERQRAKMLGNKLGCGVVKGIPLFVYEAITGKFIKEFNSIINCTREITSLKPKRIQETLKRNGTFKGYYFSKNFLGEYISPVEINPIRNKRAVICITLNIKFSSISEAAKYCKCSIGGVSQSLIKNTPIKGFEFKYDN